MHDVIINIQGVHTTVPVTQRPACAWYESTRDFSRTHINNASSNNEATNGMLSHLPFLKPNPFKESLCFRPYFFTLKLYFYVWL